jgi:23S rRNA pseudouridine955/2504/2580 synthase
LNRQLIKQGLKRMFLHAWQVSLPHPVTGVTLNLEAPLPAELEKFTNKINKLNNILKL